MPNDVQHDAMQSFVGTEHDSLNDLEKKFYEMFVGSEPGVAPIDISGNAATADYVDIGALTHAATAKTTLVDADELGIWDSVSSAFRKITWANVKIALRPLVQYFTTTTVSSASGVVTIDLSALFKRYELTLTEDVTSWVFTNLPAAGSFVEIYVDIVQHASAAKTVVSPASAGRSAGGAWTVSSTVSARQVLVLHIDSAGTKVLFPTGVQA